MRKRFKWENEISRSSPIGEGAYTKGYLINRKRTGRDCDCVKCSTYVAIRLIGFRRLRIGSGMEMFYVSVSSVTLTPLHTLDAKPFLVRKEKPAHQPPASWRMSYALGSATQKRFVKNYAPFLRNMLIVADRSDACFFKFVCLCALFPYFQGRPGALWVL